MNGASADNEALVQGIINGLGTSAGAAEVLICPPFAYLGSVAGLLAGSVVMLGAQNASQFTAGAYTGEVSAAMLADIDCRFVIVGHSERRSMFAESDDLVAEKFLRVQENGMTPIICLGETLEHREAGETERVVARQIDAVMDRAGAEAVARAVIAYEPVWAIGTGRTASPEQANAVHEFIRRRVRDRVDAQADDMRILYGGSVNPGNCEALFAMPEIDGGLIGGASLKAEDFVSICRAAD